MNTTAHLTVLGTQLPTSLYCEHNCPPHCTGNTTAHLTVLGTQLPTSLYWEHNCPPHCTGNTTAHLTVLGTQLPTSLYWEHNCPPHCTGNTTAHLTVLGTQLPTSLYWEHNCPPHCTGNTTELPTSLYCSLPNARRALQTGTPTYKEKVESLHHNTCGATGVHTYHSSNLAISGHTTFGILTDVLKEKGVQVNTLPHHTAWAHPP